MFYDSILFSLKGSFLILSIDFSAFLLHSKTAFASQTSAYLYLSTSLSVFLSICLCLSVCLLVCLSLSVWLAVCPCLSVCLSVSFSLPPSIYPSAIFLHSCDVQVYSHSYGFTETGSLRLFSLRAPKRFLSKS